MRKVTNIKVVEKFDLYDITVENDHCFELGNGVIAHNSMYPKQIVSGGTGGMYSSNTVFIIGRQQEKDSDGEISGWNFVLNIEKSRKVKERSRLSFLVTYEGGISKYSGLLDLALEGKFIHKPSNGWYQKVDPETGETLSDKMRAKQLDSPDFWDPILQDPAFQQYVEKKFKVAHNAMIQNSTEEQE